MSTSVFGTSLLVSGSESLLTSRIVAQVKKRALQECPDAEVNELAANKLEDVILSEVLGGSLFASQIVAVIDDLGSCPASVVDELVAIAANPPAELCLIMVHDGSNRGRGIVNQLKKSQVAMETVKAPPPWKLADFVAAEAKTLGVRFGSGASEELIAAVGQDLRSLVAAVSQLAADAQERTISLELVKQYFAGRAEVTSFAVTDAVLAGKAAQAMERLRWSLNTGTAHVLITSSLARSFRALGKYLDASGSRLRGDELARHVGLTPFQLKNLAAAANGWTTAGVAEAIRRIAHADAQVKGASSDADYAVEKLVLDLLRLRRR